MALVASVAAGVAITGGLVSANQAKQAKKGFQSEADRKSWEISQLEKNRQAIPNPYANIKDVSGMAKDLSGMMSNPYANIGVSTQAAEMEIEQADIALANTLDTLRATGSSAGGATALAQAALQSKKGVAASIEKQEADNEKLKAAGAEKMQAAKIAEAERLQNLQMSEAQRLQAADVEGTKFKFGEQESRDIAKLNRLAGQEGQAKMNAASAAQSQNAAYGSMFGALGNIAGGALGGMG